jgi:hypothetical protein
MALKAAVILAHQDNGLCDRCNAAPALSGRKENSTMTLTLPRVLQHPSPNYSPVPIRHDLFVLHDQEGHTLPSIAWLCDPRANASATFCCGETPDDPDYQLVPVNFKAWHACAFNSLGIGYEMPGFEAKGFPDAILIRAASVAFWYCKTYQIPLVWAQGGKGRGLVDHHGLGAAGGGHVDVGPEGGDSFKRFLGFVQNIDSQFKGDLPAFAAVGAPPQAHEVVQLPDTTPSPSHGGAPRNEPGDTHAHPTPSGFPAHSAAALQSDLNTLIGAGLTVDGWYGAKTRNAVASLQSKKGLFVDGLIGPNTWAAIDAALAA